MAEQPSEPVNVQTIHHLVRMMKKYDLTAIDITEGATKIRLRRRGPEPIVTHVVAPQAVAHPPAAQPAAPATPAPTSAPTTANEPTIDSPMVGTYYASSSPDSPPFVSVGTAIRPDSTVCVIEAMKVFTDIPAGLAGTITEVLVKNGQPVEFGQPLFRVRPS